MSLSPVVDLKEWCERYGISMRPVECCGKPLEFTKTVAFKGYRGIETEGCICGAKPFRVVPIGEEELGIWNSLIRKETP